MGSFRSRSDSLPRLAFYRNRSPAVWGCAGEVCGHRSGNCCCPFKNTDPWSPYLRASSLSLRWFSSSFTLSSSFCKSAFAWSSCFTSKLNTEPETSQGSLKYRTSSTEQEKLRKPDAAQPPCCGRPAGRRRAGGTGKTQARTGVRSQTLLSALGCRGHCGGAV